MNPIERGARAKALLEDALFKEAFEGVRAAIIDRIERCPLNDSATAEDLRRCMRLLRDVRANLEVAVQDGQVLKFRLDQDEATQKKRRLGIIPGFFR